LTSAGILKHVKDVLRECPACPTRRSVDDGAGGGGGGGRRRVEEEEEEDGEEELDLLGTKAKAAVCKHELVFVSVKIHGHNYAYWNGIV